MRKALAPALAPVVKFPVQYLDLNPHWQSLSSILYWIDCAQGYFWKSESIPTELQDEYHTMYNTSSVMRCNTCEIYGPESLSSIGWEYMHAINTSNSFVVSLAGTIPNLPLVAFDIGGLQR